MFKVRISLFYSISIVILVLASLLIINSRENDLIGNLKNKIRDGEEQYKNIRKTRETKQDLFVKTISDSKLTIYLKLLHEFKDRIIAIQQSAYEQNPDKSPEAWKSRMAFIENEGRFIESFISTLTADWEARFGEQAWVNEKKEDFQKTQKDLIKQCVAIKFEHCIWDYTYNAIQGIIRETSTDRKSDLVLISDWDLTGIADSKNSRWTDRKDFINEYPMIKKAAQNETVRDIVQRDEFFYIATASPIYYSKVFLGVVVVMDTIDEQLVLKEKRVLNKDVSYFSNNKLIISSLKKTDAEGFTDSVFEDSNFIGLSVPMTDYFANQNDRVVISVDKNNFLEPYRIIKFAISIAAIIILLLGLLLINVLIREFMKPFEIIDQGIHEIINGNQDFNLRFDFKEEMPRNLAESISLMVMILLGKEIPEDEEEGEKKEEWADQLLIDESGIKATAVDQTGLQIEQDKLVYEAASATNVNLDELFGLSADSYYRKTFNEFIEARKNLGLPVDKISYIKFIEKLARNEQLLKRKWGVKTVRFVVQTKDNNVSLIPIKANEKPREQ
jgi:hypothetical protein